MQRWGCAGTRSGRVRATEVDSNLEMRGTRGPVDTCSMQKSAADDNSLHLVKFILFSDLLHWDVVTKLAHSKRILMIKKMAPDKWLKDESDRDKQLEFLGVQTLVLPQSVTGGDLSYLSLFSHLSLDLRSLMFPL